MKRSFLAILVLLGGTVSLACADYVKIMFNVGGSPEQRPANQPNAPQGPGGELGTGNPGAGAPGVGLGGPGRGLPGLGGPGGGRGLPGGGDPGGTPDDPRGGRGLGDLGPGGRGAPGGGELGGPGGGSAPGIGLGAGGPGGGDIAGGLQPGAAGLDSRAVWVEGVVEFDGKEAFPDKATRTMYFIKHKFGPNGQGQTWLPVPLPPMQNARVVPLGPNVTAFVHPDYRLYHVKAPTLAQRLETRKKELTKAKQDTNAAALVQLAQWCLEHGQLDEVAATMAKAAKADPKHPAVAAFLKTDAALKSDLKPDADGEVWRERLGNFKILPASRHYRVVYEETEELAKRLAARLEANFRAFYYWWALKGHVVPMPERRLVAVLVEEPRAFDPLHRELLDAAPLAADGFLARRDNVAIISKDRLDPAYDALVKYAKPFTLGSAPDALLTAKGWRRDKSAQEIAYAQTLTLLQVAMQEEALLQTATHEGTRQLLAALNVLPRSVIAPQWIDYGAGAFFETPKGAFWPGTGAAHWVHLRLLKDLERDKKLEKAEVALKAVVTDRQFREARDLARKEKEDREKEKAAPPTPPKPAAGELGLGGRSGEQPASARPPEPDPNRDTADKLLARARAHAWGLTYFLLQQRRDALQRYYAELQQLPRDLQFDEDVLWRAFMKAFELESATKPGEVDGSKLLKLASEWQRYMRTTEVPAAELQRDVTKDPGKTPGPDGE